MSFTDQGDTGGGFIADDTRQVTFTPKDQSTKRSTAKAKATESAPVSLSPSVDTGGGFMAEPESTSMLTSSSSSSSSSTTATTAETVASSSSISTSSPKPSASTDPEVAARIERNRLAALERREILKRKRDNDYAIEMAFEDPSVSGTTGVVPQTEIEKHAKEINRLMTELEPLPKNNWTKFYDYDLSTMKDTKAGFIKELDESDAVGGGGKRKDGTDIGPDGAKKPWAPTVVQADPSIFLGAEDNSECQDCGSIDLDFQLFRHFHVAVCNACRDNQPEKYSLLTKTECRQDYLLTDPELRDTELFPFWEKPNPKKATWNNMMLYLRCQVEAFAFKKWNGPEGLDQEFEKREREKSERKEKKFKQDLKTLRNKTRTSLWLEKRNAKKGGNGTHVHQFGTSLLDPKTGASVQVCGECGIEVECEEF